VRAVKLDSPGRHKKNVSLDIRFPLSNVASCRFFIILVSLCSLTLDDELFQS
jgi:hypothetical protein